MDVKIMTISDLENIKQILTSDFDDFWTYNILKEELHNKNSKYIVAQINNEIIGFAGIKIILNEADIMNIVVKKDFRNQGFGFILLNHLISLSKELNLDNLFLEVNEANLSAIHIYEKAGFKNVGIRKNYYINENAIIMTKKLN